MPDFDVEAARKSGATDDQILSYLVQKNPNFDVQGALGKASKQDVITYLATHSQGPQAAAQQTTSAIGAEPSALSWPGIKSRAYRAADYLTNALPGLAATGGGLGGLAVGGPLSAIGGAGMGGMAGEAGKQLLRRSLGFESPQTSQQAARDITKEGLLQGGIQAASEALPFAAGPLRNAAVKQYERALAPTTQQNKVIAKNIIPEMVDRGITGSPQAIKDQAVEQAGALRPQLNQAYDALSNIPIKGSGAQVIADLEKLKGEYIANKIVVNKTAVDAITGVQDVIRQFGDDISPDTLRQVKKIFDKQVAARGGYAGGDLSTAYLLQADKAAANSMRDLIHSTSPDIAALDKEMTFWLNVKRVAGATASRRTGQEGGLGKVLSPLAASLAGGGGYAIGGHTTGLEAAVGTYAASQLAMAMRSPAWRTTSAVLKDRLASALVSGNTREVVALSGRIVAAGVEASGQEHQTGNPQPALGQQ